VPFKVKKKRFSHESNFKVLVSFRVKEGFGVEDFLLALRPLNYFKVLAPCMHVKDP
jgi:hypothetical protein